MAQTRSGKGVGLMAGYGVQLWTILQDVYQRCATRGHRAAPFLSNAGVLQVGVNDHGSARLVSDLLGQVTVIFKSAARAMDPETSGSSFAEQHVERPLLTPDGVRNLPASDELLFIGVCFIVHSVIAITNMNQSRSIDSEKSLDASDTTLRLFPYDRTTLPSPH
ncbi:type IV secretory pathway TraG/TraD family ATPase VirD4 [Rhizobium mesoamericanum]|nr:type IV secretory system conjugative DNA transfer family protein [Rhizobium mesoamericanum]MDQ0564383.1 type IV secretory pathway TraG/TraD family ATPase VirD4 [Rhizobium mesoamericanum]